MESRATTADDPERMASYFVGRSAELGLLDDFVRGTRTVLNLYGPGGIGKTAVTNRWERRARTSGLVLATRDVADGVMPVTLLHDLRMKIASHPGVSAHVFREFDETLREHLLIEKVLVEGGGARAVFDALGQVQDPVGLSSALAKLGQAASERVQRRFANRAALDRYWRGADRALAEAFSAALGRLVECGASVVLVLDTFENAGLLDDWVCRHLAPDLPRGTRLVIAGRNQLTRTNFDWHELGDTLQSHALSDLTDEDARAYLRHHGVTDARRLDHALTLVGGYPLLLMLLCHLARSAGGWDAVDEFSARDRDELAAQLLDRIMREDRVGRLRELLERGAIAPWLRPDIIEVLLQTDLTTARDLYDELGRHSFAERHPFGLRLHDKIRELLAARFEFTDPQGHRQAVDRLANYLDRLDRDSADPARPSLLTQIGSLLQELGDHDGARTAYQDALRHADGPAEQAAVLINSGGLALVLRDADAAEEHFREALARLDGTDARNTAVARHGLGNSLELQNRLPEAQREFIAAFRSFQDLNDAYGVASSAASLGILEMAHGSPTTAIELLTLSLATFQALQDTRRVAATLNNLGIAHSVTGNYETAVVHWRQAHVVYMELGDDSAADAVAARIEDVASMHASPEK